MQLRNWLVAFVGALACLHAASARASSFSASIFFVDETTLQLVEVVVPLTVSGDTMTVNNWKCLVTCAAGGFQITDLDLTLDPDPIIAFGSSVTDIGAPSSFSFVFQQTIVPTSTPGQARASFSGSTTNGGGFPGSVTVTPTAPPAGIPTDGPDQGPAPDEMMVFNLSTNGGATWLNPGLDLGPAFSQPSSQSSGTLPPENTGFVTGPALAGVYDTMRVDLNFSLSGGNDTFTFNGDAEIVPEPTTAVLMALGLVALGAQRRRRR